MIIGKNQTYENRCQFGSDTRHAVGHGAMTFKASDSQTTHNNDYLYKYSDIS
jgi:hypothetical protein